jgi:hypothetical protein
MGEWNSANGQLGEPKYPGNPTVLQVAQKRAMEWALVRGKFD